MQGDLISRSAAINAIHDYEVGHMSLGDRAHLAGMSATLKRLPTIEPPVVHARCSNCAHLCVVNAPPTFAICSKTSLVFRLWELDTREHWCTAHIARMDAQQGGEVGRDG